ncbi:MAG: sugar ABC transporter ATP-binding protein [Brevinematales bacterium]
MNTKNNELLRVENISKEFPGVRALSNVNFSVNKGEIVALVGENGAGKSTLMKILCGAYKKDCGKIYLNGEEIEIEDTFHAQKLGIAIIYQEFNLTRNQTVAANIFMTREPRVKGIGKIFGLVDKKKMEKEAEKILNRLKTKISPNSKIAELSVSQNQMVEIAKALAVESKIIIMDEPTAAIGEKEVEILFDTINSLKKQGIGIIFISHRLEEVFKISDRIVVMRDGQVIGELNTKEATVEQVVQMMVGRNLKDFMHKIPAQITTPVLEVKNLSRKGKVENVNFTLRHGEILGFSGLVGAGRTEMARLLFGIDKKDSGDIFIDGQKVNINSPESAVKAGVCLVPEDRAIQGLVLKLSVLENIIMSTLRNYSNPIGIMNSKKIELVVHKYVKALTIRTPHLKQKVMYLSGGNQQKIVLSKWLASRPKVLILDEPTRGIDVGAKAEIYNLICELANLGMGIIMISSELPEILGICDRIVVMHEGKLVKTLERAEATQEIIMTYASGQNINFGGGI